MTAAAEPELSPEDVAMLKTIAEARTRDLALMATIPRSEMRKNRAELRRFIAENSPPETELDYDLD